MAALREVKRGPNFVHMVDKDGVDFIRVDNVRLSFPKLAQPEPETDDQGQPRLDKNGKQKKSFSGVFMAPKATHEAAKNMCKEIIEKLQRVNETKVAADKKFITDGDGSSREEYEGHYIISARETKRPPVRRRNGDLVLDVDEIESLLPAGIIVNVLLRPWYYSGSSKNSTKTYPKRISCGLAGVQYNSDDGTRFASGATIDESDAWDTNDEGGAGGFADDEDDL